MYLLDHLLSFMHAFMGILIRSSKLFFKRLFPIGYLRKSGRDASTESDIRSNSETSQGAFFGRESWIHSRSISSCISRRRWPSLRRAAHERCDAGGGRGRSHRMSTPFSTDVSIQTYTLSPCPCPSCCFLGMMDMLCTFVDSHPYYTIGNPSCGPNLPSAHLKYLWDPIKRF